jgi:two-component system, response regulator
LPARSDKFLNGGVEEIQGGVRPGQPQSSTRRFQRAMMVQEKSVDILLVEDDANDAALTLRALKQHHLGDGVVHVVDGDEALEFIFATNLYGEWEPASAPRLILLDWKLREVGGLEVLGELKSQDRTKNIPVVVLTSSREEIQNIESNNLGVNSYVVKPADSKKYAKIIGDIGHYWLAINQSPNR